MGGERLAREIEETLASLSASGQPISKLSVVGYSLGGLIARYSIGLLYSRGWFAASPPSSSENNNGRHQLQPINFTAFASPFLGVRTPSRGYHTAFWNALGGRTLSASGTQLFLLDTFRDTGRPLLSVLADPKSIFVRALSLFKHRTLYANIQNDRSAPFYTTFVSARDPYADLSQVDLHPLPDYDPTILDPRRPVSRKRSTTITTTGRPDERSSFWAYLKGALPPFVRHLPLYALVTVLSPIAASVFLLNSGYQTFRSVKRMRLHNDEASPLGLGFRGYRLPLMVEGAVESVQARQPQEYLDEDVAENRGARGAAGVGANGHVKPAGGTEGNSDGGESEEGEGEKKPLVRRDTSGAERDGGSESDFPKLALAPEQFDMVRNLDRVGWRKYAVNIEKVRHTHAAIIVRMERESFAEGRVVIRHWLEEEFEV